MKAEIEARIAALKAEYESKKSEYEVAIAAEEAKLKSFLENVPAELHNLERSAWERLKAFFASL